MLLDCDCSQQFAYKGAVNLAGRDCPFSFRTVVRYLLVYIQIIRLRYSWGGARGPDAPPVLLLMPVAFLL